MRVLVTGSTGLLGSNLISTLEASDHAVIALVRSTERARRLLPRCGAKFVQGDMCDVAAFSPALQGCDAVCHTVAYHREYYTTAGKHDAELQRINVEGTRQLVHAARNYAVPRFVHISSCGVLGMKPNGQPGDEDTPPLPMELANAYFASKLRTDEMLAEFARQNAQPSVLTIIPAWMLGPGDASPSPGGRMVLDFLTGKVPGVTDGGQSMVDARDVAESAVHALECDASGRYVIAGEYRTVAEIFASLERVTGIAAPRRRLPYPVIMAYAWLSELYGFVTRRPVLLRPTGARALHAKLSWSSEKAVRDLGITFRPLDETMRDTVQWFREHGMAAA